MNITRTCSTGIALLMALFAASGCTSTSDGSTLELSSLSTASLVTETLQSAVDEKKEHLQENTTEQANLTITDQTELGSPISTNPLIKHAADSKEAPSSLTALFGMPRNSVTRNLKDNIPDNQAAAEDNSAIAQTEESPEKTAASAATAETSAKNKIPLKTPDDQTVKSGQSKSERPAQASQQLALVTEKPTNPTSSKPRTYDFTLPGVRENGGFEIKHRNTVFSYDDIDAEEADFLPSFQLASAPGVLRSAPNGLRTQHPSVQVSCLNSKLVGMIKTLERRFGKPAVVTSGYRSPAHNMKVNGARRSLHMSCAAADIQIAGVSKWEIAKAVRAMPGRGGVGTYCHTNSVHIDTGAERDWNWRCRRK